MVTDVPNLGRQRARLAKLLALTTSSAVHEAAVARRAADALMLKYGLTEVDAKTEELSGFYERPLGAKGWDKAWRFALVTVAARSCGAEAIALRVGKRKKVRLVGERRDVEDSHALYSELLLVVTDLEVLAAAELASDLADLAGDCSPSEAADAVRLGMVWGIAATLKKKTMDEAMGGGASSSQRGRALARVRPDHSKQVKAKYDPVVGESPQEEAASPILVALGLEFAKLRLVVSEGGFRIRRGEHEGTGTTEVGR
jgi:hypothetical protein